MTRTTLLLTALVTLAATTVSAPATAEPSEAQKAKAKENFRTADANGDEKLDRTEFEVFLRSNAADGIGKAPKVVRFGAFDRAFAKIDGNKDGFVSAEETSGKK